MGEVQNHLVKFILAALLLVVLLWAISFLIVGKGGAILDALKNLLRFGK